MAELTQGVMFREESTPALNSMEVASLNYELMDVLGTLEPGSREYIERAKTFREEVSRRRTPV